MDGRMVDGWLAGENWTQNQKGQGQVTETAHQGNYTTQHVLYCQYCNITVCMQGCTMCVHKTEILACALHMEGEEHQ